jgi:hypothetical protein
LVCSGPLRRVLALERERLSAALAFRLSAFKFDLPFRGTPILTVAATSQTSPIPLRLLSVCSGFGIPTQLS